MKNSILLFLFFPTFTFPQTFCLKDSEDKSAISYSHIKFSDVKGGTYSDQNGYFTVDSVCVVRLSHINYIDTSFILNPAFPIIYLRQKKSILEEVAIVLKDVRRQKWPTKKAKESNYLLNVPSYETGTVVTNHLSEVYLINKVSFPVKLGIDTPILKINIYELDSAKKYPAKIVDSQLLDIRDIKRNKLSVDFSSKSIELAKNQSLFIAIELVGYKQKDPESFVKYDNLRDPLRIKIRKRQDKMRKCYIRHKHSSLTWYPSSFFGRIYSQVIMIIMNPP